MMGCSNPHPHSQIWAVNHLPNEPRKEYNAQQRYWLNENACLLCDYLAEEAQRGERIVATNGDFTALVPFWAVWPFEIIVSPIATAVANRSECHGAGLLADICRMRATITSLRSHSPIQWAFIRPQRTGIRMRNGTSTRTFIHRCCARPR
jgi:hypothetical protein